MLKITPSILCCIISIQALGQKSFEVAVKPTEMLFLNFEGHVGFVKTKYNYGVIVGFRPSTQQSGKAIPDAWNGAGGRYERRFVNKLYDAYTIGVFGKRYLGSTNLFVEGNIFYRNWHFDKKYAFYDDAEKPITSFEGTRTENVNVYCLKILFGKSVFLHKRSKTKLKLYFDIYGGVGIRYQEQTYETFNGTVGSVYYSYRQENAHYIWPSPQLGVIVGLSRPKHLPTNSLSMEQ